MGSDLDFNRMYAIMLVISKYSLFLLRFAFFQYRLIKANGLSEGIWMLPELIPYKVASPDVNIVFRVFAGYNSSGA